jgi:hypothetical protein
LEYVVGVEERTPCSVLILPSPGLQLLLLLLLLLLLIIIIIIIIKESSVLMLVQSPNKAK